jgi:NADPH:quinone reductase-like Zn-dependent oxidoreductase
MNMRAIELNRFGPAREVLTVVTDACKPVPGPEELLINVRAASVNPVDCAIRSGYGKDVFRSKGQVGPEAFPIRLGRDAAGVVAGVGERVEGFSIGDAVYTAPTRAAQAEFIVANAAEVAHMPRPLDFIQAASLPFVAMTTWNALVGQVGVTPEAAPSMRILVTRGAGGVGSFAIQLMKAWGAHVASICSTRNVEFVRSLGADEVVDYTGSRVSESLRNYDVVLDGTFDMEADLLETLKTHGGAAYITITSPKVRLADELGLEEGLRRAEELLAARVAEQARLGRRYFWGFMRPDGAALAQVSDLVTRGQIRPVVDRVFPLADVALAHEYCEAGKARGKIVLDFG